MIKQKKICFITGSTDGIGFQTALDLSKFGYKVILHGRNESKTKSKAEEIYNQTKNEVDFFISDFTKFDQISSMCESITKKYPSIDILLLNAGMYSPNNQKIEQITIHPTNKKAELTFAVNHLSNFLIVKELLPSLKKSESPRIIHVSSMAHNNGRYDSKTIMTPKSSFEAYCNSKLCNVLFSNTLHKKFQENRLNITSNSLHPGVINTNLLNEMGFNGSSSLEEGASTSVYLATFDNTDNVSGKYFVKKKVSSTNKVSDETNAQDSLWKLSEELLGFSFDVK